MCNSSATWNQVVSSYSSYLLLSVPVKMKMAQLDRVCGAKAANPASLILAGRAQPSTDA